MRSHTICRTLNCPTDLDISVNNQPVQNLDSLAYLPSYFITASGFDAFIEARMQALLRRNLHSSVRRVDHASIAHKADQHSLRQAQGVPKRFSMLAFEVLPYLCALQDADGRVIH